MFFLRLELLLTNRLFGVLGEPFNGLDSHGVNEMRELFLELKKRGKIIC